MTRKSIVKNISPIFLTIFISAIIFFLIFSCDTTDITGVRTPEPGTIRIFIHAAESDKMIIVAGDTARVGDGVNDSLALAMGQARAFVDEKFAVIYQNLDEYRELTETYNILAEENGSYKTLKIYESFLPPDTYDSLGLVISADYVQIGTFQISIVMPANAPVLQVFRTPYTIKENKVTEIHLVLKPFESMVRFKDTYEFRRQIEIEAINIL